MFYDIPQDEAWLDMRIGKITGSAVSSIMANFGKAFGEPAKEYSVKIALEQITGNRCGESYTNAHMERGHQQEPIARALYEEETFSKVLNGGFFDNGLTAVSPDGRINDNGLIEIKSVIAKVQYATIKRNNFDSKYVWQLCFELRETGLEWVDYVSFCADFPEGKRLFIQRIFHEDLSDRMNMIDDRLEQFMPLIDDAKKLILGR